MIDVFHRIRTLNSLGVDIHLHTFQYGRPQQDILKNYCSQIHYYQRNTGAISAISCKPYIVKSRQSQELVERLSADNLPILVEGLHCCSLLEQIDGNRIIVRAHNVEHDYYNNLAAALEKKYSQDNKILHLPSYLFRRAYFRADARRLERYEPILIKARAILAITEADAAHFRSIGCKNVLHIPGFHPYDDVVATPTTPESNQSPFVLYQGDLSVGENIQAVLTLADTIISRSSSNFVVAGRNPDPVVRERLAACPNATLVANPNDDEMLRLMAEAQVQMLVTSSPTGLKLKLVNALFSGRHLLVNSNMVAGTDLAPLCHVADDPEQQLAMLEKLMLTPFGQEDISLRRTMLMPRYSNRANAEIIINEL